MKLGPLEGYTRNLAGDLVLVTNTSVVGEVGTKLETRVRPESYFDCVFQATSLTTRACGKYMVRSDQRLVGFSFIACTCYCYKFVRVVHSFIAAFSLYLNS